MFDTWGEKLALEEMDADVGFPPTIGHERSWRGILKAVLRLCRAFGKFVPFRNRPQFTRLVTTCDFLKAATGSWGLEQLKLGLSRHS